MLKIIKDLGLIYATEKSKRKNRYCLCECPICKKQWNVSYFCIKNNKVKMCMNCSRSKTNTVHGFYKSNLDLCKIISSMKQRCNNTNHPSYIHYGGRGITVCEEWNTKYGAKEFSKWALENGYKKGLEIDRIDNDKGYSPENCRWTDRSTNMSNTRIRMSNNSSGYKGICVIKNKNYNVYRVVIHFNKIKLFSKSFMSIEDAVIARNKFIIDNNLPHKLNEVK